MFEDQGILGAGFGLGGEAAEIFSLYGSLPLGMREYLGSMGAGIYWIRGDFGGWNLEVGFGGRGFLASGRLLLMGLGEFADRVFDLGSWSPPVPRAPELRMDSMDGGLKLFLRGYSGEIYGSGILLGLRAWAWLAGHLDLARPSLGDFPGGGVWSLDGEKYLELSSDAASAVKGAYSFEPSSGSGISISDFREIRGYGPEFYGSASGERDRRFRGGIFFLALGEERLKKVYAALMDRGCYYYGSLSLMEGEFHVAARAGAVYSADALTVSNSGGIITFSSVAGTGILSGRPRAIKGIK